MRRAEPATTGALLLEAAPTDGRTELRVVGSPATPSHEVEAALEAGLAWIGVRDDPTPLGDLAAHDRRLAKLYAVTGPVRLGRLPRLGEAFGRAVIAQLVQSAEAHRSIAQLVRRAGEDAPGGLTAWPRRETVGAIPSWELRRCGISGRGARALHAGAVDGPHLERAEQAGWDGLDARLRALPGVGVWTSAVARRARGDPDAVAVGDYNLPALIAWVLGDGAADADDATMLELLAPFAGQRGRVIRLVERAVGARAVSGPPRRAPRAPLSAHRYW
ncbi:hypothetical protein ER308_20000 [Egibacter rhizosphaerae]|uniref:DNA-3-methyladenine glycosylase 2 family protein n=1 Tax=Egibacter rhizosphaerae TaxID=1670831 RepID=A0A411YK93_9ACTN|nr:hypothetical protein ER308_20000 [Egibacter rhizosphaerae]